MKHHFTSFIFQSYNLELSSNVLMLFHNPFTIQYIHVDRTDGVIIQQVYYCILLIKNNFNNNCHYIPKLKRL